MNSDKSKPATRGVNTGAATANKPDQLPPCPEGNADANYNQQGPCRRKRYVSKRKPTFRVPLKKEDGNMEAQVIEYNAEYPNRVVVRLEYLMQTTKVRLNDRHYMDDLYEKLLEEERRALNKATKSREKAEQNRMKKLIIEGLMKKIPPELAYLHQHPVFRVNQMLARLKSFDNTFTSTTDKDEITPIEPYEFDGNKFFRNLHETGTVWEPSLQKINEEEKLQSKIRRAKLRLLQRRKEETADAKALRILNNPSMMMGRDEPEEWDGEGGDGRMYKPNGDQETEDELLNRALRMETVPTKPLSRKEMLADKIQAKSRADINRIQEKIKLSKERDREREAEVDLKRQEHEKDYLDTIDYEKIRIISQYDERVKQRTVDEIFQRKDFSSAANKKKDTPQPKKPFHDMFAKEKESQKWIEYENEDPLFRKMRKVFDVPGSHPFSQYQEYDNDLILEYLDSAVRGTEFIDYAEDITKMYGRQQEVADDYLNRKLDLSSFGESGATQTSSQQPQGKFDPLEGGDE